MGKKKHKDAPPVDYDVCWICCGSEPPLLPTGCACRGSAGLAHLSCVVEAATHDVNVWTTCPTCRQEFTGAMDVGLAKARWELVRDRPSDDAERLFVANNLAVTLKESAGDNAGALTLMEEVLTVRRKTLGDVHPDTLDSIINLALQHNEMGNFESALPLSLEAVASAREQLGSTNEHTLVAISCLAAVHNSLRNFEQAKPLHEEALAARKAMLGEGHLETMNSTFLLGQCLFGLGQHEEGLALLEEASERSRKVLGKGHPSSKHFLSGWDDAKTRRRDYLAMKRMEEEEGDGVTASAPATDTSAAEAKRTAELSEVVRTLTALLKAPLDLLTASLDEVLDVYIALKEGVDECERHGLSAPAAVEVDAGGGRGDALMEEKEAAASVYARALRWLDQVIDAADAKANADESEAAAAPSASAVEAASDSKGGSGGGGGKKGKKGGKGGKKKKVEEDWEDEAEIVNASSSSAATAGESGGGSGGDKAMRVAALAKAKIERDGAAGGFKSMRTAYDELGADGYYEAHGSEYTNPHEPTITVALRNALDCWSGILTEEGCFALTRCIDVGCGSGEATSILSQWPQSSNATLDACDPYTYLAFEKRMGRPAYRWSFEDIAGGVMDERPPYDLAVASFALHLIEPSYLYTTLSALARSSRCLIVVTPHKRPVIDPSTGWKMAANEMVHERVRLRLYVAAGARRVEDEVEAS